MQKMLDKEPDERIGIDEILQHPWFTEPQEDLPVFKIAERIDMIKKFFVAEDEMHWRLSDNVYMDINERLELHDEYTLANLNSTASDDLKNHSTKSIILAPNNSTWTDNEENDARDEDWLFQEVFATGLFEQDKTKKFSGWTKKARLADVRYENEHNANIDNGVIKEDANELELAKMIGYIPK